MIKVVISDIGGVLITPAEKVTPFIASQIFPVSLDNAIMEYTASLNDLRTGNLSVRKFFDGLQKKYGVVNETEKDLEEIYSMYYERQALINEEMMVVLAYLHEKYHTIAFSNMNDLHAKINRSRNLFRHFDEVYLSSNTRLVKPDESAFQHVLSVSHLTPQDCLFTDDKKENVDVAKKLGMMAYTFDTVVQFKAYLAKNGLL